MKTFYGFVAASLLACATSCSAASADDVMSNDRPDNQNDSVQVTETTAQAPAGSPVSDHGFLKINGTNVVDQYNQVTQLRGVSFGWHNWWPRFYNEGTVKHLATDWGAEIVRAAIGIDQDNNTFDRNPNYCYQMVDNIVQPAIENGLYVIVDFHSHNNNLDLAKKFFGEVSKKYGDIPNVIYEIWNEPLQIGWQEIKDYAEAVIPIIRANSPKSLIIVGTPSWDQEVDKAAASPIANYDNLAYALHFYAATHGEYLRQRAREAIAKGLPIFISECASMEASGDGPIDTNSWDQWMQLANEYKLSWCAWSIADKYETCSMLYPSANDNGMYWTEQDLKPWGKMVKDILRQYSSGITPVLPD